MTELDFEPYQNFPNPKINVLCHQSYRFFIKIFYFLSYYKQFSHYLAIQKWCQKLKKRRIKYYNFEKKKYSSYWLTLYVLFLKAVWNWKFWSWTRPCITVILIINERTANNTPSMKPYIDNANPRKCQALKSDSN